ncbi:kunitz-type protease inhibitor 1 isoform X1 [Ictalurus furcatus]|uniref:kunitz-type protease inhibitor 1 isoform X1 n=1 Tax=Ictalurus furcatus TaxID=66913 RepID=UPI002350FE9B|nr:kunitz-type protease inhibitor 1 isoform X1 [Ictalurus furcatus]
MMMRMPPYWISVLVITISLLQTLLLAQNPGEQCFTKFSKGKEDFVLETDESVKFGAQFIGSPQITGAKECVSACCKDPSCNLALMEDGAQEGTIKSCFLFNCLYKQKKVCRFVRKEGFSTYVLTSVFGNYLEEYDKKDHSPRAIAGQDRVVQPHDIVMLNGLESRDDHEIVQFQWTQVSGIPTAVMEKTNFKDEVRVSNLSAGVYKFRLTVTDDAGQSDSAEVTVLVLTPEQSHHHCLVPKKVGPCRGSFPRWHYSALSEKCEKFTFGGCNPNRNNYLSREECVQACDQVSIHTFPSSGRHGPVELPSEECGVSCGPEKFICANGCCLDKALECDQAKQCSDGSDEDQCANMDSKFRRLLDINDSSMKDNAKAASYCTQPPITGPCRNNNAKWYYNPYEMKCIPFNYGGCNGNNNQFDSEQECMDLCRKVTDKDAFERQTNFEKQVEDGQSVSIAIAVALGLAILILLSVLGYCVLKEKKGSQPRHQHVSANGAHLLPVEDTDKLVYNSTTKPI